MACFSGAHLFHFGWVLCVLFCQIICQGMSRSWQYPCNFTNFLGVLESWLNIKIKLFKNINFFLIFMRRYQRYGCDAIVLWMWHVWNAHCLTIYYPIKFYHSTFVIIWNGSGCQFWHWENIWNGFECFEDCFQIAMVMGLINPFLSIFLLLACVWSDYKMVMTDWDIISFIGK